VKRQGTQAFARRVLPLVLASIGAMPALAADWSASGFGTLGYARSNQDSAYLRHIDQSGTLKADSLLGAQLDVRINSEWGATAQVVASAPSARDDGVEAKMRWAFISYRPTNDWLLRAGKLRPPVFIHTQNMEVGMTYDQARLPAEVYTLTPMYDFNGVAAAKTWLLNDSDMTLEGYWGQSTVDWRFFMRDAGGPSYVKNNVTSKGLVLSYSTDALLLRGGAHFTSTERDDGQSMIETFAATPVPLPAPFGGTMYAPSGGKHKINSPVFTLGADWRHDDWRITAEYANRRVKAIDTGPDSQGAYITLARRIGKWTPYITQARLLSDSGERSLYQALNSTPVPLALQAAPPPFGPVPATAHRMMADAIPVYDQSSTMIGASYAVSPTSKIKMEVMRTRVGLTSSLFDGGLNNQKANVYSLSYSQVF
jgi:hypothetical protein